MPLRKKGPKSLEEEDEQREDKELKRLRKQYAKGKFSTAGGAGGRAIACGFLVAEDAADDELSQSDGISDPIRCNAGPPQQGARPRMGVLPSANPGEREREVCTSVVH